MFHWWENFFVRHLTKEQYEHNQEQYKNIIEEQVAISYAINGISFEDTNEMTGFDRKCVLDALKKIREAEKEAHDKAIAEAEAKRALSGPRR